MALIFDNQDLYSFNYWHIRNIHWDKGDDVTTVDIAAYFDETDRNAKFPTARDSKQIKLPGCLTTAQAYEAILLLDDWQNATSDE